VALAATENPWWVRRLPTLARAGAGLHDDHATGDPSMTRRSPRVGPLALALTLACTACAGPPTRSGGPVESGETLRPLVAEIESLERERAAAQVAADVPRLERLFAAELRYGHSNGAIDDKTSLLDRVASGAVRYEQLEVRDLSVQPAGGGAALVRGTARVRAVGPSGAVDATLTYLAVWTRRDGRWELLAYQSARATP
jgi:hypothetical protein